MKIQLENVLVESIKHSEVTAKSTGTVYPKAEVIIAESIVTPKGEYVDYYPFTFFGDKATLVEGINKGALVNITGYTKGNLYEGKCFLSINATYISLTEKYAEAVEVPETKIDFKAKTKAKAKKTTVVEDIQSDELPF